MNSRKNTQTIIVKNNMTAEKRNIIVYHQSGSSAHSISPASDITLTPLKNDENDFIHISAANPAEDIKREYGIRLNRLIPFEFTFDGKASIVYTVETVHLSMAPGPPNWQLKLRFPVHGSGPGNKAVIIIGDSNPIKKK